MGEETPDPTRLIERARKARGADIREQGDKASIAEQLADALESAIKELALYEYEDPQFTETDHEEIFEDDYQIKAKLHENGLSVSFEVYKMENGEFELSFTGFVKWDGCSNWNQQGGCLHFCGGAEGLRRFQRLIEKLLEIALELMPEHEFYLEGEHERALVRLAKEGQSK